MTGDRDPPTPLGFDREPAPRAAGSRSAPPEGPGARPPGLGHAGGRARWPALFLVVAGVVLLVVVGCNTLRTRGASSSGPPAGAQAPRFAAPLALGDVEGDVNVAVRPGQGAAGSRPACDIHGTGILNSCDLFRDAPVALAFLAASKGRCADELDALASVARRHPGVRVAAISERGSRDQLRALVRARGWRFPVAHDADGVLANLYGVAVCPQITYVLPGGRVLATSVGTLGAAELDARLTRLQRAAASAS